MKIVDQYGGIGGEAYADVDSREAVMKIMRVCTDRQQLILIMKIDGYDNRYIAEHLKISETTVRVILRDARKKLCAHLNEMLD